jgi:RNA 3'-terminal phosphate cyclase (ATP)
VNETLLTIDGAQGEGGGQILRTSLALSMCLGKAIEITRIRANRSNPGLQPQHLAAVTAAKTISRAHVEGAQQGSLRLAFMPQRVVPGDYNFSIGTAGSTTLVLQTVLPALMLAGAPSNLRLEGGTHNPLAPPYEFISESFLPLIQRMGPTITTHLERPGFAPRGGGIMHAAIHPVKKLEPLSIRERGNILQQDAEVLLSHLPRRIADRELDVISHALVFSQQPPIYKNITSAYGPGNVALVKVQSEAITEVFSSFGRRGLPAETVAQHLVDEVSEYLDANVPVGKHLADQLLIPVALAGQGVFLTQTPSSHTKTNIAVIRQFMGIQFKLDEIRPGAWLIDLD